MTFYTMAFEPIRATTDAGFKKLAKELRRQSQLRKDYIVPAKDLKAVVLKGRKVGLAINTVDGKTIHETTLSAHRSLSERLGIPWNYCRRLGHGAPFLLARNVNAWLRRDERNFMVRLLDNKIRAILSDRYRPLDSAELFEIAERETKRSGAVIASSSLTEQRFYMRILAKGRGMKAGTTWLRPGVVLSNSDVGLGRLKVELCFFDRRCENCMISHPVLDRVHFGRQVESGEVWSAVAEMIHDGLDPSIRGDLTKDVCEAQTRQLADPNEAIDAVVKRYGFSEEDKTNILRELEASGSDTVFGLVQAVTATGRDKASYDDAIEFERAGGDILEGRLSVGVVRSTHGEPYL